jgi:hypothetical protein
MTVNGLIGIIFIGSVTSAIVYGCKIWSLTLRKTEGVENRVRREIFGAEEDEVTGDWSKLHSEELSDLYG